MDWLKLLVRCDMNEGLSRIMGDSNVGASPKECYVDTLIGNLQRKQRRAQQELDNVNAALVALNDNPAVANLLELISKASR